FVLCAFCKFPPPKNQHRLPQPPIKFRHSSYRRLPSPRLHTPSIRLSHTPSVRLPPHSIRSSSLTPHSSSSRLSSLIPHFYCLFIFSDSTIQRCIQRHQSRVHGATSRYQFNSAPAFSEHPIQFYKKPRYPTPYVENLLS
ncbi:hypothetical protein LINPERHAP2_LOCUS15581, partial [Linum perenne]